jgi:hypothetical protein
MSRTTTPVAARTATSVLPAAALVVGLLCPVLVPAPAQADDGSCVGSGEYAKIKRGMSMAKLQKTLHGQVPFAETEGHGPQRYRWYVACDDWQPDLDVAVRFHQPVVGRRTVTKKALESFVA